MSRNFSGRLQPYQSIHIETLEGRTLLAADPIQVIIGSGGAKSVQFTDPSGIQATLLLTGAGTATCTFQGSGLSQLGTARGIVVQGVGVTLGKVQLLGTDTGSTLRMQTRGRGTVTSGDITSNGSMNAILAPSVVLDGDLTTAMWTRQIQLAGAQNGKISIGSAHLGSASVNASLGNVSNESFASSITVESLKATQWVGNGGGQTVQAPRILGLNVKGQFAPDLTLQGAPIGARSLDHCNVGSIVGGTWTVGGSTGAVEAAAVSGWDTTFIGPVKSIAVSSDATSVSLTAESINSLSIHGNLANSTLQLTTPLTANGFDLQTLSVGGGILNTNIQSQGSVGTIAAARMLQSSIFAGIVRPTAGQLPQMTTDFASTAQIKSLSLRKSNPSFQASDVAAYLIGNANLGDVAVANNGVPFGLAAHQLHSLTLMGAASGKTVHVNNPASSAVVNGLLASKGIAQADFVVRII